MPKLERTRRSVLLLGLASSLAACTMTRPDSPAPGPASASGADPSLDAEVDRALERLYVAVGGARSLVQGAAGVLVFPRVVGGALVLGGSHGRGALRVHDRTQGYYSTTSASIGWQAGAGSKTVIYVFNEPEALLHFQRSAGWTVGVDATVAAGHIGANGRLDSRTLMQPVTSFVMNNVGVEGGVSLNGAKVTRRGR